MRLLTPFTALLGGAAAVVLFVLGLSALVFEPPTDPAVEAEAAAPGDSVPGATIPPPDARFLTISGDREDVLTMGYTPPGMEQVLGPGQTNSTEATTSDGGHVPLSWETDPGGSLYLRHFQLDGLDFFLDPGDCTLTPGEIDAYGQVTVAVDCSDITDLRETATIAVSGVVDFSYDQFPPPGFELGGEATMGGDIEATVPFTSISWVYRPDPDDEFPGFELTAQSHVGDTWNHLALGRDAGGSLSVRSFQFQDPDLGGYGFAFFELEAGTCPAPETLVETTGPATAIYRVSFDCPTMHSTQVQEMERDDYTISLRGELTAHRLDRGDG